MKSIIAAGGFIAFYLILAKWAEKDFNARAAQGFRCVCGTHPHSKCHYCGD